MSNGKGSAPRSNHSKQWRDNYDSMTLSLTEAIERCAVDDYVWYAREEQVNNLALDKCWRPVLGFNVHDDGTCGYWGNTYFKCGVKNSRVRKQITHKGKTVLLLDKDNEVVT